MPVFKILFRVLQYRNCNSFAKAFSFKQKIAQLAMFDACMLSVTLYNTVFLFNYVLQYTAACTVSHANCRAI
jgi:hypothetical protein